MPPRWIKNRFSRIPRWIKKPLVTRALYQSGWNLIVWFKFILAVHSYFGIGRELINPRKGNDHTERSILKLIKCLHRSRLLDHFFNTHSYVLNHRLWVTKNKSKTCNILFSVHPGTGRYIFWSTSLYASHVTHVTALYSWFYSMFLPNLLEQKLMHHQLLSALE